MKISYHINNLIRIFVGIVFVYASYHKIIYPAQFAKIVYGYYIFPHCLINIIAILVPFLELTLGLFLIFKIYYQSTLIILAYLISSFIFILSFNLIRGHSFDCGCFSFGEANKNESVLQLVIRDVIYLILVLYLFFKSKIKGQKKANYN